MLFSITTTFFFFSLLPDGTISRVRGQKVYFSRRILARIIQQTGSVNSITAVEVPRNRPGQGTATQHTSIWESVKISGSSDVQ